MNEKKRDALITAGKEAFLLHGYSRVTMGEIAKAAGISRPSLYLIFPRKEDIFTAVTDQFFSAMLTDLRNGLSKQKTEEEKLTFAFEVWCVKPFELVQTYPEAKDLLQSSYKYSNEITTKAFEEFCLILSNILEPLVSKQKNASQTSAQLARILATAVIGFKASANSTDELRYLLSGLIKMVMDSIKR